MEVICLESAALYELVEQVVSHIRETYKEPEEKWISPEKAMSMLNITSRTTLQKFRDEGRIRYTESAKKNFLYDRDSIYAYLDRKAKNIF